MIGNLKGWLTKEKHGTRYRRQPFGSVRGYPTIRTTVTLCAATERNAGFVKSPNTYLWGTFPGISWTAIAILPGDGHCPMTLHVHLGDDSAPSAELCVVDFEGGEFRTGELIHAHGPIREGDVLYGRGCVVGHIVDPPDRVIFNVWCPHYPLPWRGKRYGTVMYTGLACDKVPAVLQRRMHELNILL